MFISVLLKFCHSYRFDVEKIMKIFFRFGLIDEFKTLVKGFADSLQIIRNLLPERRKNKQKFSIQALATDFLSDENLDSLHNAVDDVKI